MNRNGTIFAAALTVSLGLSLSAQLNAATATVTSNGDAKPVANAPSVSIFHFCKWL